MHGKKERISWLSAVAIVLIACVISVVPLSASAAEETPPPAVSYPDFVTPTPPPTPPPVTPPPVTPPPDTPPPVSSTPDDPTSAPTPTQNPDDNNTPTPTPTQNGENTPSPTPSSGASATPSASPGASASPTAAGMITARPSSSPLATPPGSDYQVIATVDARGNEFSIVLFYGGAAAIFLGLIGIIVLIVLYVKNRKKRGTLERDGIFEEIEDAETRSAPPQYDVFDDEYDDDYDPYEQYDTNQNQGGGTRYSDDYAAPAAPQPGPVMPMDISMYTDEFDRSELYKQPEAQATEDYQYDDDYDSAADAQDYTDYSYEDSATPDDYDGSQVSFDTDEILREALRDDEDYGEDE